MHVSFTVYHYEAMFANIKINKKTITAATISYVKSWFPVYSGEYLVGPYYAGPYWR